MSADVSTMQLIVPTVACLVVSFLICGIPFGLIIAKISGKGDIRQAGSGNIGTTNALRVAGPKVAAATLLFDVLKGVLCVCVSRLILANLFYNGNTAQLAPGAPADWTLALIALICLCGHVFSPYLHFKGGKGIAVGVGVLFGWYWPLALLHLAIFIVLVAITKYVSVGSIATAACVPLTVTLAFPYSSLTCKLLMSLMGVIVVWAHRGNIKKLLHGKESKLSFSKRVSKMDDES